MSIRERAYKKFGFSARKILRNFYSEEKTQLITSERLKKSDFDELADLSIGSIELTKSKKKIFSAFAQIREANIVQVPENTHDAMRTSTEAINNLRIIVENLVSKDERYNLASDLIEEIMEKMNELRKMLIELSPLQ